MDTKESKYFRSAVSAVARLVSRGFTCEVREAEVQQALEQQASMFVSKIPLNCVFQILSVTTADLVYVLPLDWIDGPPDETSVRDGLRKLCREVLVFEARQLLSAKGLIRRQEPLHPVEKPPAAVIPFRTVSKR